MKNFWQELPCPFTVLAPLDGVTDFVFRQMITKIGKPDVLFTEFTSCDGLQSEGRERVLKNLLYKKNEQPIIAQVFGANPENFYKTARDIQELGFAGIDINTGCPHRSTVKDGSCAGLIKNPKLMAEIITATKKGAVGLPVSVKTRIGFQKENIEEWIGFLLKQKLSALSVHLRTVKELSKVNAHWEYMSDIINLRNKISPETILIGNGDIISLEEVEKKYNEYGCEGFMIGRGIFANPWIFNTAKNTQDIKTEVRFKIFLEHIMLFKKTWEKSRNFANLKKMCKTYINNFPDASSCREKIMQVKSLEELVQQVTAFQKYFAA